MSSSSDRHRVVVSTLWRNFLSRLGFTNPKLAKQLGVSVNDIRQLQEPSAASTTARTRNEILNRLVEVIPNDEESATRLLVAITKSPRDVAKVIEHQLGKMIFLETKNKSLTSQSFHKDSHVFSLEQKLANVLKDIEELKKRLDSNG
jgi:hypothetical protein